MNKLVSKNPIQRFKQGNQIQYYEIGGTARKVIRGWKEALFPWTMKKPKPQQKKETPQQTKQKNDRAANRDDGGYFINPRIADNSSVMWLLRNGYRQIDGVWMSPEEQKEYYKRKRNSNNQQSQNPSTTTQQSNPQQSETSNVTNNTTTNAPSGNSFSSAFNAARNSGQREFIWNGRKFNTQKKGEEGFIWSNGRWINPNIKFVAPSPTDMTTQEAEELNRKAKPIGNWERASFAKNGGTLKSHKNVIQRFRERK